MCAGDCQFFPSALPSYLVQSHKKTGYIYRRHILSSNIFYIFLHFTFYLVQSPKKQPIFIFLDITHFRKIFFTFSITYQYSHFTPFSFRCPRKQPLMTSHIFSLYFSFFFHHISIFLLTRFRGTKDSPF